MKSHTMPFLRRVPALLVAAALASAGLTVTTGLTAPAPAQAYYDGGTQWGSGGGDSDSSHSGNNHHGGDDWKCSNSGFGPAWARQEYRLVHRTNTKWIVVSDPNWPGCRSAGSDDVDVACPMGVLVYRFYNVNTVGTPLVWSRSRAGAKQRCASGARYDTLGPNPLDGAAKPSQVSTVVLNQGEHHNYYYSPHNVNRDADIYTTSQRTTAANAASYGTLTAGPPSRVSGTTKNPSCTTLQPSATNPVVPLTGAIDYAFPGSGKDAATLQAYILSVMNGTNAAAYKVPAFAELSWQYWYGAGAAGVNRSTSGTAAALADLTGVPSHPKTAWVAGAKSVQTGAKAVACDSLWDYATMIQTSAKDDWATTVSKAKVPYVAVCFVRLERLGAYYGSTSSAAYRYGFRFNSDAKVDFDNLTGNAQADLGGVADRPWGSTQPAPVPPSRQQLAGKSKAQQDTMLRNYTNYAARVSGWRTTIRNDLASPTAPKLLPPLPRNAANKVDFAAVDKAGSNLTRWNPGTQAKVAAIAAQYAICDERPTIVVPQGVTPTEHAGVGSASVDVTVRVPQAFSAQGQLRTSNVSAQLTVTPGATCGTGCTVVGMSVAGPSTGNETPLLSAALAMPSDRLRCPLASATDCDWYTSKAVTTTSTGTPFSLQQTTRAWFYRASDPGRPATFAVRVKPTAVVTLTLSQHNTQFCVSDPDKPDGGLICTGDKPAISTVTIPFSELPVHWYLDDTQGQPADWSDFGMATPTGLTASVPINVVGSVVSR